MGTRLTRMALLAAGALLCGCATEYSAIEPSSSQYVRLQDDVRDVNEKLARINQNVDNFQSQLSVMEREQENQQALVRQQQTETRAVLDAARTQRAELEKLSAEVARQRSDLDRQRTTLDQATKTFQGASSRDMEQYNRKLADVVKAVQDENTVLQRKVAGDLQALQRDLKTLQTQVNANNEHIVRVETHLQSIAARPVATTPVTPVTPPSSSDSKPTATPIVRTGTPSSPEVDYAQGYNHSVMAGETLWKIARDYNVTVQDILNTNPNITDTTRLSLGQKLFIPYRKQAGQ